MASHDFAHFFAEKLRPVMDEVASGRRRALKSAFLTAVIAFVVVFAVIYLFMSPYIESLGEHDITFWPLLFLLPCTLSVIAFSVAYILSLRTLVNSFRASLFSRVAEFIDPDLTHKDGDPFTTREVDESLLFEGASGVRPGGDRFRGTIGNVRMTLSDMAVELDAGGAEKTAFNGPFAVAHYAGSFPDFLLVLPLSHLVSLTRLGDRLKELGFSRDGALTRREDPELGCQIIAYAGDGGEARLELPPLTRALLAEQRRRRGTELYLCRRGDTQWTALLCRRVKTDQPAVLDGFDFGRCREFCDDAILALRIARESGE